MRFGVHISIEDGIDKAPKRAYDFGCECFQIFSRSPHGGKSKEIKEETIEAFRKSFVDTQMEDFFIHSPYYINFASGNNRIRHGSITAIRNEMKIADLLGARGVVTHLGSAKDLGLEAAIAKLAQGICRVFEIPSPGNRGKEAEYDKFKAKLLLEITAGTGNIMGDTFEEIAEVIKEVEKEIGKNTIGVCFDTAHAFASGYDLRTPEAVHETFALFDRVIGLNRIKLVHLNDSAVALDSHIDRHANFGEGEIGMGGITAILKELKVLDMDFVLETPPLHNKRDLEIIKEIRERI